MFQEQVIYQIYPRSFADSNGDGVGDLGGIIEHLDYLKKLGVDMIWLNPIYPSPQKDNGYDISDYCAIDPLFGSMNQFEELVEKADKLSIGIMLDMVFNHTSTEHPWFKKALQGDKKYQDYYIIEPPKKDGNLPTNWQSKFGGNAWAPFGDTGNYYLHLFAKEQADLNWKNPEVRQEVKKVVNFWLDKGVKGFRFDVINLIDKGESLQMATDGVGKSCYTDLPKVHDYLKELLGDLDSSLITVGEMSATTTEAGILYTQPQRQELKMIFQFHHLKVDYANGEKWSIAPCDFSALTTIFHHWGEEMSKHDGWNALFWNNHDQPRALNRFGDSGQYRVKSAMMLAAALHLNRGTPYIYQGEEIGMLNPKFTKINDYQDIESHNAFHMLCRQGKTAEQALAIIQQKSRDNSRTPIPWTSKINGGFTTGEPWIKLTEDFPEINVKQELQTGEIYKFYQQLIHLRKKYPIIALGKYQSYLPNHPSIYAFERSYKNQKMLVLNNFTNQDVTVPLKSAYLNARILISNDVNRNDIKMPLTPYETVAFLLDK